MIPEYLKQPDTPTLKSNKRISNYNDKKKKIAQKIDHLRINGPELSVPVQEDVEMNGKNTSNYEKKLIDYANKSADFGSQIPIKILNDLKMVMINKCYQERPGTKDIKFILQGLLIFEEIIWKDKDSEGMKLIKSGEELKSALLFLKGNLDCPFDLMDVNKFLNLLEIY